MTRDERFRREVEDILAPPDPNSEPNREREETEGEQEILSRAMRFSDIDEALLRAIRGDHVNWPALFESLPAITLDALAEVGVDDPSVWPEFARRLSQNPEWQAKAAAV